MCANLAHPTDDNEIYTPTHNALSGQTVSSMYKLKDINNQDGAFFIFGDLSVKVEGAFRLKLTLFEITSTGSVCLQSIFTSPFVVYPTKKFPGMLESTFLSRSFSDQGARIRIRKENRSAQSYVIFISVTSTKTNSFTYSNKRKFDQAQLNTAPAPTHRRSSITSSTDGSESSHNSPIVNSPRVSLPPLSPPQQTFDKLHTPFTLQSTISHPPSPPAANINFTIKLPPILTTQATTPTEQDAVFAMMQLSHTPARKKLFI